MHWDYYSYSYYALGFKFIFSCTYMRIYTYILIYGMRIYSSTHILMCACMCLYIIFIFIICIGITINIHTMHCYHWDAYFFSIYIFFLYTYFFFLFIFILCIATIGIHIHIRIILICPMVHSIIFATTAHTQYNVNVIVHT